MVFILLLSANGLRYLHENKIIHRDWKPSNILKAITPDGETFYKLCDFGAARICEENGQFMSIVGTEEYLVSTLFAILSCRVSSSRCLRIRKYIVEQCWEVQMASFWRQATCGQSAPRYIKRQQRCFRFGHSEEERIRKSCESVSIGFRLGI